MAGRRTQRAVAVSAGAACMALGVFIIAPPGPRNALVTPLATDAVRLADRYAGVLSLLALTGAMVAGLVAALRGPLDPTQRLRMQAAHRAASTAAVGALVLHIVVKIAATEVSAGQAVLPVHALTAQSGHVVAVGLGSLAAYLLLLVVATGVARGWFAGTGRPVRWRVMHAAAYACWFFSVWHGLTAGRQPATWVTLSYVLCGVLCAAVVGLRIVQRQRRRGRSMTSTGSLLKVGVPAGPPTRTGGAHAASGAFPLTALTAPSAELPLTGAGLVSGAQAARADLAEANRSGEWSQVGPTSAGRQAQAGGPAGPDTGSYPRVPTPAPSPTAGPMPGPVPGEAAPSVVPRSGPRAPKAVPSPVPVPSPAGGRRGSKPGRRGRGRDEQRVSDEAFWAFMKGDG